MEHMMSSGLHMYVHTCAIVPRKAYAPVHTHTHSRYKQKSQKNKYLWYNFMYMKLWEDIASVNVWQDKGQHGSWDGPG